MENLRLFHKKTLLEQLSNYLLCSLNENLMKLVFKDENLKKYIIIKNSKEKFLFQVD